MLNFAQKLGGETWSQKGTISSQSVFLDYLSMEQLNIWWNQKPSNWRNKNKQPSQISLSPDAFACLFFEERMLFSSSIFMKTAKLIENILLA